MKLKQEKINRTRFCQFHLTRSIKIKIGIIGVVSGTSNVQK